MTPEEQLDEARAKEAVSRWKETASASPVMPSTQLATIAARLAREGWTPPEPVVDQDVLAFREWETRSGCSDDYRKAVLAGKWDHSVNARAYLAGARMAREQERERANHPVAFAVRVMAGVFNDLDHAKREARKAVATYQGEA